MRLLHASAALALILAAPARAQLSNRAISVESGLSAPLGGGAASGPAFAVAASTWIGGDVEAFARVARTAAAGTGGRGADAALAGTVGLRLSLGPAPLRLQLLGDLGWARVDAAPAADDRFAFGLGAGVELFAATDLSVAARAALRGIGGEARLELALAVSAYF
jgi:hypothetical protein